ncbi:MAG: hypothetical protein HY906_12460 [Deltaproteobacteria bacterium]|nr:hypothetical protein [Deltaproteobacteria bacterium]
MMKLTRALLALVPLLLVSRPAAGIDEMEGARAVAMGGALRAAAASEAGIFLNPAGMPLTKAYSVQALFDFRPQDSTTAIGVAITDSVTNRAGVAAGLYYTFLNAEPKFTLDSTLGSIGYTRRGHEAGLALAYPLAERFILGVTNKYVYLNTTDETGNIPGARSRGYTLDVGLVLRLSDAINFAAVGQNVVPMKTWETPPTLGVGLALAALQALVIDVDLVVRWLDYRDDQKLRTVVNIKAGGEYFVGNKFPVRLGYSWDVPFRSLAVRTDVKGESFFHAGLGFMSTQFGIEAAVRQQLSGSEKETLLAFALKLFVQ